MGRILSVFLLLCFFTAATSAQTPVVEAGVVKGVVHSRDGVPLTGAVIALRRSSDTTVVATNTSDSTGAFRITGLSPGSYIVELRRLGYTPARRVVAIGPAAESVDIGVIAMVTAPSTLDRVLVTSVRPSVTALPDRNVYSTTGMPVAGGTATDVLRNVPELQVSPEGSVTSRGATPQIHINGRPAPMQGEALDRYLQQIPADRVDRIEVIANPSAKYEAEGEGGIVNIVLKRGTDLGLSGSVAINAGTRSQRGGSGSINLQQGRLSIFGSGSASFFANASENSDLRQNLSATTISYIQQDSHNRNSGGSGNASVAAELKAGKGGTLWADATAGTNASDLTAQAGYTYLDFRSNPTERYDRANSTDLGGTFSSFAGGYRYLYGRGQNELSLEVRRNENDDDQTSESSRQSLALDGSVLDLPPLLTFAGQTQSQTTSSAEANWKFGFGPSGKIEMGYRGSARNTRDNFSMWVDAPFDVAARDDEMGDFRQRQLTHAGFFSVSNQIGRVYVQAGLRGEQAQIRRENPLSWLRFKSSYGNFFPNVVVSTTVGSTGQLSMSYSKRVDIPWGVIVNAGIPSLDPLNRRVGNPYLTPRYAHSFSLTLSKTGALGLLQFSPYYRRTLNGWEQVRFVDSAGVSTVTWENIVATRAYGGSVSASLTPTGRVGGFVNLSAYREVRDGSNLRTDFSGASTQFTALGNANFRATSMLNLQASLTYLPGRQLPQGSISPMVFSTIGLRQQLWARHGTISLLVTDPFELQRFTFTTRDQTHVQTGRSTFSARRATLSITYNFGRPRQRSVRTKPEETQPDNAPVIR